MNIGNIYYLSERGGKKNQEDYIWPVPGQASPGNRIFIVCDGVGGAENGEVASRIVAESAGKALSDNPAFVLSEKSVNELLMNAQHELIDHVREFSLNADMATTFTLLAIYDTTAFIGWCGDSRVYHLRNGEVLFKTSDHSLVNSLIRNGEITEDEAMLHPQKNIILRAVKADDAPIEAEGHWINDVKEGDHFLLCTDGLLENITDNDLKFLLDQKQRNGIDLVEAFQQFCRNKTRDNYSMYLIELSTEKKSVAKKRSLTFLLLLLLCAAVILFLGYYFREGAGGTVSLQTPPVTDTAAVSTEEPYVEIVNETDEDSVTAVRALLKKVRTDTAAVKKNKPNPGVSDSLKKSPAPKEKSDTSFAREQQ